MIDFISSYLICYAIGYMLWGRPYVEKKGLAKIANPLFYASLIGLATTIHVS